MNIDRELRCKFYGVFRLANPRNGDYITQNDMKHLVTATERCGLKDSQSILKAMFPDNSVFSFEVFIKKLTNCDEFGNNQSFDQ